MSKARITYRFESARRAAGQAAENGPAELKVQRTIQSNADHAPAAEEKQARGNVIPLRHDEFRLTDDTIVLERELPEPLRGPKDTRTAERLRDEQPEEDRPPRVSDPSALQSYPYDYGAWSGTTAEEIDRLEQIIRSTDEAPRRRTPERDAVRNDREPLPEEDDDFGETGYWRPRSERTYAGASEPARHSGGGSWWKMGASIVGAIATGVLFGSFVLSMFTGDPGENAVIDSIQGEQSVPQGSDPAQQLPEAANGAEPAAAESAADYAAISIPSKDLYLLQNGKFSTLENARTLAEQLKGKGLAATIEENGSFFWVYAGVTSDRDAALRISRQLQKDDVEVYINKYTLPAVKQIRWAGDAEAAALASYLDQGSKMVQMIGDLTLVHLDGGEATAPVPSTMDKLSAEHRALTKSSAEAAAGLPADAQPMIKRMDTAVTTAVTAVREYAANPDPAYLWSAQSAVMDYVIAEKQLLTSIAVE
ncbi:SPOR domain-containing protein [Paenibacillus thermotolerans]|uniref:SPOR domain-containing protein n=1 Tax=Paenibacillus thermotolerans TaxID=3027807 RepID=UPI002368D9E7|nr:MULTISPECIES: SPOR domain-containing protein [unclassified Paenibacillus]